MCVDISKVYTFISSFEWSNFFSTLAGAGFGAWGAYLFNLKQEDNRQKQIEKAKLVTLFYDMNIFAKYLYIYGSNTIKLANSICEGDIPYNTPLSIDIDNIKLDKLDFIANKNCQMYEILYHTFVDIVDIKEQGYIYNEAVIRKKEDSLMQLIAINKLFPRIMAKIYACMFNINSLLIKDYNSENLIKDNIINSMAELLGFIDNVKKQYIEIIKDDSYFCKYTNKPFSTEQKELIKEDINYLDYILNTWIIDFKINKKKRQKIQADIQVVLDKNREVENDL